MKAVSYLRVSTDGQSVDPQRLELKSFAASKGTAIVAEFADVISGTKFRRDGMDLMMAAAERGEFDTILVVKLDRLGRSISAVLRLIERLDELGVAVIVTSQGIDTSKTNPCGRLIMNVLLSCAEFERSLIVERTKAGLVNARANGKILGHPSTKLVPDWRDRVTAWKTETGGVGLRALRVLLGGVSLSTAAKCADAIGR